MSDRLPAPMAEGAVHAGVERASATPAHRVARAVEHAAGGEARPPAPRSLVELETWMLRAITGTEDDAAGAAEVLLPSPELDARARLEIYRSSYVARLVDCLRDDYPVLAETLGDARFDALAEAYVERHPSTLPNLNPFGRYLAAFCREAAVSDIDAFAADLAALEWALVEVLHAAETGALDLGALGALAPEAWSTARFERADAVRVLRFDHPVNAFYQARRSGASRPEPPAPAPTATAIYRRGVTLWRMDLTPAMANLLEALFAGSALGAALDALGAGITDAAELAEAERNVMVWFREWVSAGFFSKLATTSPNGALAGSSQRGSKPE